MWRYRPTPLPPAQSEMWNSVSDIAPPPRHRDRQHRRTTKMRRVKAWLRASSASPWVGWRSLLAANGLYILSGHRILEMIAEMGPQIIHDGGNLVVAHHR